jgi:hypothetical protein
MTKNDRRTNGLSRSLQCSSTAYPLLYRKMFYLKLKCASKLIMHKLPAHKAKMPSLLWLAKINQQKNRIESTSTIRAK